MMPMWTHSRCSVNRHRLMDGWKKDPENFPGRVRQDDKLRGHPLSFSASKRRLETWPRDGKNKGFRVRETRLQTTPLPSASAVPSDKLLGLTMPVSPYLEDEDSSNYFAGWLLVFDRPHTALPRGPRPCRSLSLYPRSLISPRSRLRQSTVLSEGSFHTLR